MRLLRWLFPMALIASIIFTAGWTFARTTARPLPPGTEYLNLRLGVNITYDDGSRLVPGKSVRMSYYRLGDRRLPDWQFVTVTGRPDDQGFMSVTARVPIESWRLPLAQRLLK